MATTTTTTKSNAALAFEQRSAAAVAQIAAAYDTNEFTVTTSSPANRMTARTEQPAVTAATGTTRTRTALPKHLQTMNFKAAQMEADAKLAQELQHQMELPQPQPQLQRGVVTVARVPSTHNTAAQAQQLEADAKMAQALQKAEYRKEEARMERQQRKNEKKATRAVAAANNEVSWSEWFTGTTTAAAGATTTIPTSAPSQSSTMVAGMGHGMNGGAPARVAEPVGNLFSCVAHSINTVLNPNIVTDGNVRGVDSSSLI